jgi:hypothetical protein
MADSRDNRNYGSGRRLQDYMTCNALAERARASIGRGSKFSEQCRSALASLLSSLKEDGISDLKRALPEHIEAWADSMTARLESGDVSSSTTSSYASALNQVFKAVGRNDLRISAHEHGIGRGQKHSNKNMASSPESREALKTWLAEKAAATPDREEQLRIGGLSISAELQQSIGLRIRESCLIKVMDKEIRNGHISLKKTDGTKNGRPRESHVYDPDALTRAQELVRSAPDIFSRGSLTPGPISWEEQFRWAKSILTAFRRETGFEINFHGARHAYAHQRYSDIWTERTGIRIECPVMENRFGIEHIRSIAVRTGLTEKEARDLDERIRGEVSEDLGHGPGRRDIGWSYLGR